MVIFSELLSFRVLMNEKLLVFKGTSWFYSFESFSWIILTFFTVMPSFFAIPSTVISGFALILQATRVSNSGFDKYRSFSLDCSSKRG